MNFFIFLILSYHTVDPANISSIHLPFEARAGRVGRAEVEKQTSDCVSHATRTKPLTTPLTRGFPPGSQLVIEGMPTDGPVYWFSIDLLVEPGSLRDIALHINARLLQGKSVLNTKTNCNWGPEEPGPSVFRRQIPFRMEITATESKFKIVVNSTERAFDFPSSSDPSLIQELRINGAVTANVTVYETPLRLEVTELSSVLKEGESRIKKVRGYQLVDDDLPLGMSDFTQMIEAKKSIVDKTGWIAEALTGPRYKLITRPRRFGKTTNLSMLEYFLLKDPVVESKNLFAGFNIVKDPKYNDIRSKHQHQYAVFYFSFLHTSGGRNALDYRTNLAIDIGGVLHTYLDMYQQYLEPDFKESTIENVMMYPPVPISHLLSAFQHLIRVLKANGYKIAILIDEYAAHFQRPFEQEILRYDTNGEDAVITQLHSEAEDQMRQFYNYFFRDGVKPDVGIIIGISYMKKASIFSELSNFRAYTNLDDEIFSPFFGFTGDEVNHYIHVTKADMKFEGFKEWYEGYHFGNSIIFNPYSVVEAIYAGKFDAFWGKSGSSFIIKKIIANGGSPGILDLHFLVSGYSLEKKLYEELVLKDLFESEGSYWTLLAQAGYVDATKTDKKGIYRLKLPNKEVREYLTMHFESELKDAKNKYDSFVDAFNQLQNTTNDFKNYLDTRFNTPSPYYHLNISDSIEAFGKAFKSVLVGIERDEIFSGTVNMNHKLVYQLIMIKNETIFTFNLAKMDAMPTDSASDEVHQLINLPPAEEHSSFLKKRKASRSFKTGILFFGEIRRELNKQIISILIKTTLNKG